MDNLIFNASDGLPGSNKRGKVAAVLDWELSTLGDPFADLAYVWYMQ